MPDREQYQRDVAAARALGYGSPYERRKAEGAAKGRSGQDLYGKAERAASSSRASPRERAVAAGRRSLRVPRRQTQTNGQVVTNTISRAGFVADVRQAAADGLYVSVTVTAGTGSDSRTRTLTAASFGRVSGGGDGEGGGGSETGSGDDIGRKVQATYGPAASFAGGTAIPAADLLDELDDYDDPFDFLYDWWEEEYL